MVITIENTDDFIRALRENEGFQAAARRELLTQDLIALPQKMDEFEANTNKRFDEISGEVTEVRRDIDGLGESFSREIRAQPSYRVNYAQRTAIGRNQDIARLFANHRGIRLIETRQITRGQLVDWLKSNIPLVDSLNLRGRAWDTFLNPDDIAEVRELQAPSDSDPAFYVVVEASYTGEEEDLLRATDHAKIVHAITGLDAYPVVAAVVLDNQMDAEKGSRIYEDLEQFVKANDRNAALWYRLNSADLRLPEPR